MIKVLQFIDDISFGGAEKVVLQLSKCLPRDKFTVEVVVLYHDKNEMAPNFPGDVKIHYLPFSGRASVRDYIKNLPDLISLINRVNPDIVNSHNANLAAFYMALGLKFSKFNGKFFKTAHAAGFYLTGRSISDKIKRGIERLAGVIYKTKYISVAPVVMQIQEKLHTKSEHILIYNGVDTEVEFSDKPSRFTKQGLLKIPEDSRLIVYAARMCEGKNHETLLHAVKDIIIEDPKVFLLLLGDGEKRERLEGIAAEMGIERNVLMPGNVSDVGEYLKLCEFGVFPSESEGFSLVLLEKFASSLPVVASSIPAFKDVVNQEVGMLYDTFDAKDLERKIRMFLNNPHNTWIMGKQARKYVVDNYSQEKMISQYVETYLK